MTDDIIAGDTITGDDDFDPNAVESDDFLDDSVDKLLDAGDVSLLEDDLLEDDDDDLLEE